MNAHKTLGLIDLTIDDQPDPEDRAGFQERRAKIEEFAPRLGLEVRFYGCKELEAAGDSLRACQALWLFGRIPEPREDWRAWETIQKLKLPESVHVFENPDAVHECFNLKRSYSIAQRLGVPQAESRFIDLPEEPLIHADWWKRLTLWWRLLTVRVPDEGVFIRSYYGTPKVTAYACFVKSKHELLERAHTMIETLRGRHVLGGLAVRDLLPIAISWDKGQRHPLSREYRVFIGFGKPLFWSIDVNLDEMSLFHSQAEIEQMASLSPEELSEILRLSEQLGQAFQSCLLVADFAVLGDGSLALVETNPGMMCGWAHRATFLGVYAQLFRKMLGLPSLTEAELIKLAEDCNISLWGRGRLFDFVGSGVEGGRI